MDTGFLSYVAIGFLAQLIDGALGMAYGVISMSFLLSLGVGPASASASVHVAEVFTTGISGLSHLFNRNIDRRLLLRLVLPGCVGAALGALLLSRTAGDLIRPFIAGYLIVMGTLILGRALGRAVRRRNPSVAAPLGFVGGFLDAFGGGGWGPVVTSSLLALGTTPRYTIGSVNLAEFFVCLSASAIFVSEIGLEYGQVVLGLLAGGAVAAPFAGYIAKRVPAKALMLLVGVIIIALSLYNMVDSYLSCSAVWACTGNAAWPDL